MDKHYAILWKRQATAALQSLISKHSNPVIRILLTVKTDTPVAQSFVTTACRLALLDMISDIEKENKLC